MTALAAGKCIACRRGDPALSEHEISDLLPQIPDWQINEIDGVKRLQRIFKLKNFLEALEFTNRIGGIAEEEDHHPLISTEWGKVTVQWWTHVVGGLHKNDFIMAAKTEILFSR